MSDVPRLRLFFEWGGGVLWGGNEVALRRFDVGPVENQLPLPREIRNRLLKMKEWHDTALDWSNPIGPSPWSKEEDDNFSTEAKKLFDDVKRELGASYELVYEHSPVFD